MSECPFNVGERVKHKGAGVEGLLWPELRATEGEVLSLRTAYKRPGDWVADVLFEGQRAAIPVECSGLEAVGSEAREVRP